LEELDGEVRSKELLKMGGYRKDEVAVEVIVGED